MGDRKRIRYLTYDDRLVSVVLNIICRYHNDWGISWSYHEIKTNINK